MTSEVEPKNIPQEFEIVTPKDVVFRRARVARRPITVEFKSFPIGKWQKPEDMIGHHVRMEASGAPFGEYYVKSVDKRGRVVLEPFHLDGDYDWTHDG